MTPERRERVWTLFDRAAELPPEQRGAFLDAACGADAGLRAEVESLLTHATSPSEGEDGDALLKSPLVRLPVDLTLLPAPSTPGDEPRLPPRVGRYRILRTLGVGGMGTVYEAEQDNPRRTVALKVIRPGLTSTGLVKRFTHEALILGRLHHPGIAQVYEAGVTGEGQPFFALELIRGVPLDEHAQRHRLDPAARLALVAQVCDAVQHAHDQGVIHRDLKPANILVDETGQPKVLDFGVARATDADLQTTTGHTEVGQLIGTLAYMSPEQMVADPRLIDQRTDVYALGVILFELLAGRPPYELRNLPLAEAARVVRDHEPPRLGSIDARFRGDVETIAAQALEKDKARRYASTAELASDIRRYFKQEPIHARPASALYQLRKFAARHKALVSGAFGVFVALVAGLIGTTTFALREAEQGRRAVTERHAAVRQTYLARIAAAGAALQAHDVVEAARQLADAPEELRDWEWRHLHSRLDESVSVLRPPAGGALFLSDGPEGPRVAAVTAAGLRLLDPDGRELLAVPLDPGRRVVSVAQTRAGLGVLAEDADHNLYLLDGAGKVRLKVEGVGHDGTDAVAVSPDLARVALSWSEQKTIEVYEAPSGRRLAACHGHDQRISALAFSPDGSRLASASDDGTARLWDAATGASLHELRTHTAKVLRVAFRPDGARLLTTSADGTVRRWDTRSGKEEIYPYTGHTGEVYAAAFSPGGERIVSGGDDRTVRLWHAAGRADVAVLEGHTGAVKALAFGPDGRSLTSLGEDGTVRTWDVGPAADLPVLRGHRLYVYPVAYSPDGRWIASGSWDGYVRLWDALTGESCAELPVGGYVRTLAFGPDGRWLVTGCDEDRRLQVWDVATGRHQRDLEGPEQVLVAVAVRPDGGQVAALDRDGEVKVVDVASGRAVASMRVAAGFARRALAYSPDGCRLAGAGDDWQVYLWDVPSYRLSARLGGHTGEVFSVAFSADGRRLVSASADRTVRVWDVETGQCRAVMSGHTSDAFTAVFHPDGTRIASAGRDRMIWLWDAATGEEVARLPGHTNYVYSLTFSPDGKSLASGSGDGTVRLWDTEPVARRHRARREAEALRPEAEQLVGRMFGEKKEASLVARSLKEDGELSEALRQAAFRALLRRARVDP
jgi:WD40 repeat protein